MAIGHGMLNTFWDMVIIHKPAHFVRTTQLLPHPGHKKWQVLHIMSFNVMTPPTTLFLLCRMTYRKSILSVICIRFFVSWVRDFICVCVWYNKYFFTWLSRWADVCHQDDFEIDVCDFCDKNVCYLDVCIYVWYDIFENFSISNLYQFIR